MIKSFLEFSGSWLENPRDGGAWWAAVYGVAQSWTWLKRLSSSSNLTAITSRCWSLPQPPPLGKKLPNTCCPVFCGQLSSFCWGLPSHDVYSWAWGKQAVYREFISSPVIDCMGLPWQLSGKESACQSRRPGFDPWVRKIPWRRKWQPTPVSCLGNPIDWLVGYSPWGWKQLDIT